MAEHGFLSNRLYDAAAAGAFIISDHVAGIEEEFDGGVVSFADGAELRDLVDRYLAAPEMRAEHARRASAAVRSRHTFAHRVDQILQALEAAWATRPRRGRVTENQSESASVTASPARSTHDELSATVPYRVYEEGAWADLVRLREMMFGWGEAFDHRHCHACGNLFIVEIPADMGRFYPPMYYANDVRRKVQQDAPWRRMAIRAQVDKRPFCRDSPMLPIARRVAKTPKAYADVRALLEGAGLKSFDGGILDVGAGRCQSGWRSSVNSASDTCAGSSRTSRATRRSHEVGDGGRAAIWLRPAT